MTSDAARAELERHLAAAHTLGGADIRARLLWLEQAAALAESAGLDEEGRQGALHLRAALGAIVAWSRGPRDHQSVVALDALVRTLLARGTLALLRALAGRYAQLAKARAPHRGVCAELRDLLEELARTVERGEPAPDDLVDRLKRLQDALAP